MKCLIIAAGKGSRLRDKGNSKPLVPVLGVPIIERIIRAAMQAGIDDFCVVTGYEGEKVRGLLDNLAPRLGVSIAHVINEEWEKENGLSVLKASLCLKDESFLLLMSDHLFDPEILRDLVNTPIDQGEVTLAVDFDTANPLVDIDDVTRVKCEHGHVCEIGKELADFNGFDTGIFLCTPALFTALERSAQEHGDTSVSGGMRNLVSEGKVNVLDARGRFWIDVDDPGSLLKAERALLERLRSKPNDGPVSRYLNRPLSVRISRRLVKTPITPNQISLFSFVLSLLAALFFSRQGYLMLAAGAMLAQIASVIDGCDGEVARLKFLASDYGGWFDAVLDRYADGFLLFGLTWHAFTYGGDGYALFTGFMAIIGSFMLSYTADKYDSLMKSRFDGGKGLRIGRDVRIFLIFMGALLNQPFLTLLVIAVLMNVETIRRVVVCRGRG